MVVPLSTQARKAFTCPRCGVKPGECCRMPSGRRLHGVAGGVHIERVLLATPDMLAKARGPRRPLPATPQPLMNLDGTTA